MKVHHHADGKAFLDRAGSWLAQSEVAHSLMIGIAKKCATPRLHQESEPWFATVETRDGVAACALRTPPNKAVLTRGNLPALKVLADDLFSVYGSLPAVLGPLPDVDEFSGIWEVMTGTRGRSGMHQRVFECRNVEIKEPVSAGQLRSAVESDLDLVVGWILEFRAEIGELGHHGEAMKEAEDLIRAGDLFLWCDPAPVALAARTLRTFTGISVNHVYTPPDLRCRGYATSCVSSLTMRLLSDGYEYCSLFTDVANPTSNSIYQKIGYHPVCDMKDVLFEAD